MSQAVFLGTPVHIPFFENYLESLVISEKNFVQEESIGPYQIRIIFSDSNSILVEHLFSKRLFKKDQPSRQFVLGNGKVIFVHLGEGFRWPK